MVQRQFQVVLLFSPPQRETYHTGDKMTPPPPDGINFPGDFFSEDMEGTHNQKWWLSKVSL